MATPTFQAVTAMQYSTISAITVAWPTHATNDVAFLLVETGNETPTLTTPAGFELVHRVGFGTAGNTSASMLSLYWCRATSSSMTSPVVSMPGNHVGGAIITFRGCVVSGEPWADFEVATKPTHSTTSTWPNCIVTQSDGLVALLCTSASDSTDGMYTVPTNSGLSSITERMDLGNAGGNGAHIYAATAIFPGPSGATGTSTSTITAFGGDATEVNVTMVLLNNPPTLPRRIVQSVAIPRASLF